MNKSKLTIRGFSRVQIENPDGKIMGDSGWCKNVATNGGIQTFLVKSLGSIAASAYIAYVGLGTGSAPNVTHTTLDGELTDDTNTREAVSATDVSSKTLRLTNTFSSSDSFFTAAHNIANIGLFASSLTSDASTQGTLFAGNTFASSSCNTNQNVNCSYEIRFATA